MQQGPAAAAWQGPHPPPAWPLLHLLGGASLDAAKGENEQPKARTSGVSDDCEHLLLQPGSCPRSYLSLLLRSLCLAMGLLLAPLQLRKHIHNDLQQSCKQCWLTSQVGPAGQVSGTMIWGEQ